MNKDFQDIFNKAKQIEISSIKKQQMRSDLELFIENHPVMNIDASRHILREKLNKNIPTFLELSAVKLFFNNKSKSMIATLLMVLVLGGGTSFAAERALPGDILYPAKVNINEEVRGWLAVGNESQVEWDARRAERRLEEAEKLMAEGKLDAETEAELQTRFEKHVASFRENAEDLEEKQKAKSFEAYSNFEAALQAHERILARMEGKEEATTILAAKSSVSARATAETNASSLLSQVRSDLNATMQSRANAEARVSTETNAEFKTSAEGKLKATENKIDEVKNFVANSKAEVNVKSEAEIKLKTAEEVVVRGKAEMESKAYGKAFASFQEAMRIAQEAKLSAHGQTLIKADISLPPVDVDVSGGTFLEGSEDSGRSDTEGLEIEAEVKTEIEADNATTGSRGNGRINIDLGL